MTEDRCYDVVVVGVDRAEKRLAQAGITDIAVVECDLSGAAFDEATHTWTLPVCRARIVVTNQTRYGREDLAPYLGVAVHGVPNYFMVTGVDAVADARLNYIADCLELMRRTESTRIEVLFSTQRMFARRGADKADRADASYWRRMAKAAPSAFDLSSDIGVVDAQRRSVSATTSTGYGSVCPAASIRLTADITGRERFSTPCRTRC